MNIVTVGMIHTGNGTLVFDTEQELIAGVLDKLREGPTVRITVQKSQMTVEQRASLRTGEPEWVLRNQPSPI